MIDFKIKENIKASNKSWENWKKVKELMKKEVLVGIPESTSPRKKGAINNAALLFIHTHGSPLHNIPARPLIEPALSERENADRIAEDLKAVIEKVVEGNTDGATRLLTITGKDAVKMIRNWFSDPRNNWPPNQPKTVKAKIKKKKMSKAKRTQLLEAYEAGDSGIDQPLIDTGELRKSITYVVRDKK